MASTSYTYLSAEAKKLWDEKLFREMEYESFFSKFEGKGEDAIVKVKTDLEQEKKGGQITFTLIQRLTGDGITGSSGQTLEGNEEKLVTYTQNVYLEEYSHATRDDGPLTRHNVFFSIDDESEGQLKVWGREKQEKLAFNAVFASPTKIFYGGTATSKATLTTTDKITPELISKVRAWAKTGGNRTQNPIGMVKINGKKYYVLVVHPDALFDLKRNSEFQQAMREAEVRGSENPIFSGSTAIWDGVVIHEHELCPIGTNAGAGGDVPYAECALLGSQAVLKAWGKRPEVVSEEGDYKRWHGYGLTMLLKQEKAKFNSLDYGMICIKVARTNVSGS